MPIAVATNEIECVECGELNYTDQLYPNICRRCFHNPYSGEYNEEAIKKRNEYLEVIHGRLIPPGPFDISLNSSINC